jgi:hypothetical protein
MVSHQRSHFPPTNKQNQLHAKSCCLIGQYISGTRTIVLSHIKVLGSSFLYKHIRQVKTEDITLSAL